MKSLRATATLALLATLAASNSALAGSLGGNPALAGATWSPRVPISMLAQPLVGFDPTRLHLSTEVSVGTGFGGGSAGLQVTRLTYQFAAPLSMGVSVGNAFGPSAARGGNAFFLEGLDLAYRPTASMMFQVHYQDLRSPLQYRGYGFNGLDPAYLAR
jgi:hypothetical protein